MPGSSSRTARSPTSQPAVSRATAPASCGCSSRAATSRSTWRRGRATSTGSGLAGRRWAPRGSSKSWSTCGWRRRRRSPCASSSRASWAAGAAILDRMEPFSVVGFVEAVGKIRAHYRLLARVRAAFRVNRYDLAILVDYPGYHLRAAAAAHALGIPVLYYIAPQMWAWGGGRVRKLAVVQRLAVILPFVAEFFGARGVPAIFVGLPLRVRPP